jgi:uncharacterized protein YaaW (UPF0174 family)
MLHRHLDLVVTAGVGRILRDIGSYLSGLTLYRIVGPDEWVCWFAQTFERSAMSATVTLPAVVDLVDAMRQRTDWSVTS